MSVKYMFVGSKSKKTFQVQARHQGALLHSNNDDCILKFGDSKFFVTGLIVSFPPSILGRIVPLHSEGAVKYLPQPTVFTGEKGISFRIENFTPQTSMKIAVGDPVAMMIFEKRDEKAVSLMMYVSEDTMLNPGLNRVMCNLDRVIDGNEFAQFFADIVHLNDLVVHPAVLLSGAHMKERNRCVTVSNPDYRIIELKKGMSVGCILVSKICPVITEMVAERKTSALSVQFVCNLDRVIDENEFAQFFPDIIHLNVLVMHPAVLLPGSDMKDRNRCVTVSNPGPRIKELKKGMSVGCILVSTICSVITEMVTERKNL